MKTIPSDAELREEHDETKYSSIGQMTVELRTFLFLDVGEITEKERKLKKHLDDHDKSNFLVRFID